jgi:ADP-ribose pyrophosphatase YjhB (NUDIX family)
VTNQWIPDEEWERIQRIIPVVCVDVLPICYAPTGQIEAAGLILRYTPDGASRWCLVGGRIQFGESVPAAVTRHMHDTLGVAVQFDISQWRQPLYVAQYFPAPHAEFLSDPRKHAVSLTYALEVAGIANPRNEALDFRWFPLDKFPQSSDFGFSQDRVVAECLDRLRVRI